jgi:hypothetical protein
VGNFLQAESDTLTGGEYREPAQGGGEGGVSAKGLMASISLRCFVVAAGRDGDAGPFGEFSDGEHSLGRDVRHRLSLSVRI